MFSILCFYMESFQIKIFEVQKFVTRRPPYFSQRRVRSLDSKPCALRVIPGFFITQFPSSEDYLLKFKFAVETCSYFSNSPLIRKTHQGISTLNLWACMAHSVYGRNESRCEIDQPSGKRDQQFPLCCGVRAANNWSLVPSRRHNFVNFKRPVKLISNVCVLAYP